MGFSNDELAEIIYYNNIEAAKRIIKGCEPITPERLLPEVYYSYNCRLYRVNNDGICTCPRCGETTYCPVSEYDPNAWRKKKSVHKWLEKIIHERTQ